MSSLKILLLCLLVVTEVCAMRRPLDRRKGRTEESEEMARSSNAGKQSSPKIDVKNLAKWVTVSAAILIVCLCLCACFLRNMFYKYRDKIPFKEMMDAYGKAGDEEDGAGHEDPD